MSYILARQSLDQAEQMQSVIACDLQGYKNCRISSSGRLTIN